MHPTDVSKLEQKIREGVALSFVAERITWGGLLGQDSWMHVGGVSVWVSLQDRVVKGERIPRSRVVIRSNQFKHQKVFREPKGKGFPVDRIIQEVTYRLHREFLERQAGGDKARKILDARQDSRRLIGHYNLTKKKRDIQTGVLVTTGASKREPGTLGVVWDGLTAKEAQSLLEAAKKLRLLPGAKRPSEGCRTAWEHMEDD